MRQKTAGLFCDLDPAGVGGVTGEVDLARDLAHSAPLPAPQVHELWRQHDWLASCPREPALLDGELWGLAGAAAGEGPRPGLGWEGGETGQVGTDSGRARTRRGPRGTAGQPCLSLSLQMEAHPGGLCP